MNTSTAAWMFYWLRRKQESRQLVLWMTFTITSSKKRKHFFKWTKSLKKASKERNCRTGKEDKTFGQWINSLRVSWKEAQKVLYFSWKYFGQFFCRISYLATFREFGLFLKSDSIYLRKFCVQNHFSKMHHLNRNFLF